MENTTTTVEVLGRKIHEIRGGEGPPLLYLHSAMGEAAWLPHLTALARGRELHAPAHPGFSKFVDNPNGELNDKPNQIRSVNCIATYPDGSTAELLLLGVPSVKPKGLTAESGGFRNVRDPTCDASGNRIEVDSSTPNLPDCVIVAGFQYIADRDPPAATPA